MIAGPTILAGILLASLLGTVAAGSRADALDVSWVFILTGPHSGDLPPDEMDRAMNGHFANMDRLARAGQLLVAGPLGPPRSDPAHRGIFVIDESDPEKALAVAKSDPAVEAGVFVLTAHPWRTGDPIRRVLELDRADQTARAAASPTGEAPWEGRSYVLVTAADGDAGERALAPLVEEGLVLFQGRFGGDMDGTLLACLDAAEASQAEEMLAATAEVTGEEVGWTLHGWYGMYGLEQLPFVRAHPDAPTFDLAPLPEEGPLAVFRASYAKLVDVFGVHVVATAKVTDRDALEAAHLLAQYLDADEDGEADDEALVASLRTGGGYLAVVATADELVDSPSGHAFLGRLITAEGIDGPLREILRGHGFSPPTESPDGGYRR